MLSQIAASTTAAAAAELLMRACVVWASLFAMPALARLPVGPSLCRMPSMRVVTGWASALASGVDFEVAASNYSEQRTACTHDGYFHTVQRSAAVRLAAADAGRLASACELSPTNSHTSLHTGVQLLKHNLQTRSDWPSSRCDCVYLLSTFEVCV